MLALERGSKRSAGGDPEGFVTSHDLESALAVIKSSADQQFSSLRGGLSAFEATVVAAQQANDSNLRKVLGQVQQDIDGRFAAHDARLRDVERRVCALEAAAPKVDGEIRALQAGLVIATAPVGPAYDQLPDDFDRAAVPGLVVFRLAAAAALSDVEVLVKDMLQEMALESSAAELRGKDIDRVFRLQFSGSEGLAARRAAKFVGLQRDGDGWRDRYVADCSGAGPRVRAYIDFDKSRKQVKQELLIKKAYRALCHAYPTAAFQLRRRDGKISFEQVPLLRIEATREDYVLQWNLRLLSQKGWSRAELDDLVRPALQALEVDTEWG